MLLPCVLLLLVATLGWAHSCPGGGTCDDDWTCCLISNKDYGCCALPDAVCCDDERTCCPKNTICRHGSCYYPSSSLLNGTNEVVCPGGKYTCPDDNTCCPADSVFTCCPLPDATCCSDGTHCCPGGTTCDLIHESCNAGPSLIAIRPGKVCPGGKYWCPDGTTCCHLPSGAYGCCPLPDAVCCEDELHCCPSGFTCVYSGCSTEVLSQVPQVELVEISAFFCPDGHSRCPNEETCCLLPSGRYGCCPYKYASCCSNGVHCCPRGTRCDEEKNACISNSQH